MKNNLLTEQDIKELLLAKSENKNFDYKENINWQDSIKDNKLNLVKDILAMANTRDGGKIIIGVEDNTFRPVRLSADEYSYFDQTKVNDLLHNYTEPKFSCFVYKFDIADLGKFILIDIPEFNDAPIICKKSAHSSKNSGIQILKEGQIYIRTDKAATEGISSYAEMKELLTRSIRKNSDELLKDIKNLFNDKPIEYSVEEKEKYDEEIKESDQFFLDYIDEQINKQNFGYWKVIAYPTDYIKKRIDNQNNVEKCIEKSIVELRGWNFPHTDAEDRSNFNNGFQSHTIWERHFEGYRAYQSGLFIWKKAFWEDIKGYKSEDENHKVLSFINAIWVITEYFLFFSRYFREVCPESNIHVKIELDGIKKRKLESMKSGVHIYNYISGDNNFIFEQDFNATDLAISHKEIARQVVKQLFMLFNWNDASETMIDDWQTKLINKNI